jgi:hypothetical protein
MFGQVVQASEAMREAARQGTRALITTPALSGCPTCKTVRMIAAPALGACAECGAALTVLGHAEPRGAAAAEAPGALAA